MSPLLGDDERGLAMRVPMAVLCLFMSLSEALAQTKSEAPAQARRAFACAPSETIGFENKKGRWTITDYRPNRFTMVFDGVTARLRYSDSGSEDALSCEPPWPYAKKNLYRCEYGASVIMFDDITLRYSMARLLGYVIDGNDSVTVEFGNCQAF
jgi:hypothetical protein